MDELDGRTKNSAGFATAQSDAHWWLRNENQPPRGVRLFGWGANCSRDAGEKNRDERSDNQISTPWPMQETCCPKKLTGG